MRHSELNLKRRKSESKSKGWVLVCRKSGSGQSVCVVRKKTQKGDSCCIPTTTATPRQHHCVEQQQHETCRVSPPRVGHGHARPWHRSRGYPDVDKLLCRDGGGDGHGGGHGGLHDLDWGLHDLDWSWSRGGHRNLDDLTGGAAHGHLKLNRPPSRGDHYVEKLAGSGRRAVLVVIVLVLIVV